MAATGRGRVMSRVVINACFGGFGLSPEGQIAYLARQGKQAFFYTEDRESAVRPGDRDYIRVSSTAAHGALMLTTLTENVGERQPHDTIWPGGNAHRAYFQSCDLERDDPDLVAVVEELNGKASGRFAKLEVVDVPDDAQWEIAEYDGLEHVAEVHRTWS